MHVRTHLFERSCRTHAFVRHGTSVSGVLRTGARLATFGLLAGCGGDTTEPRPPDVPIPAYVYRVSISSPSNDCGAGDPGAFQFLVIPQATGSSYSIFGLTSRAEPATKNQDTLTFSVPVQVESGTVTIGGQWRFTPERHTFAGTTSFEVVLTGLQPCTFVFATSGTHDIDLAIPDLESVEASPPVSTATAAGRAAARAATGARRPVPTLPPRTAPQGAPGLGWVYGTPGTVIWTSNTCWLSRSGTVRQADLTFVPPFPQSRGGQDFVAFRYELHEVANRELATLEILNEELDPYSSSGSIVATSQWWWSTVTGAGNAIGGLGFQVPWVDYVQGRSPLGFEGSSFKSWKLNLDRVYYVTGDVYWYRNGNVEAGSHRRVIPMTGYAEDDTYCVT